MKILLHNILISLSPKYFLAILFLSPLPQLLLMQEFTSDAFYCSLIPIYLTIYLLLKNKSAMKIPENVNTKFYCFTIFLLSLLFLIMLSATQLLSSVPFSYNKLTQYYTNTFCIILLLTWNYMIYLPALIFSTIYSVHSLMSGSFSSDEKSNALPWNKISVKICIFLICITTFICLFSTFPGIYMQDDVISVWNEVTKNQLYDWHPIGFELFCKLCFYIYESPFTVNVVQSIAWILLNYRILQFLNKFPSAKHAIQFYTLASILIFTPFVYLQVMMKDIMYSIFLVSFTLDLLIILQNKGTLKNFCFLILSGLGAALFRHAQLLPIMLTLFICVIFVMIKKNKHLLKKFAFAMVSIIILYVCIVPIFSFHYLNARRNPSYTTYTTPMAMVGSAVANGIAFSEEDKEILERVMPLEKYGEFYNKYYLDDISRSWGKMGDYVYNFESEVENNNFGKELIRMNAKIVLSHPVTYITSLLDASSIVWEIGRPVDAGSEWGVHSLTENTELISYSSFYSFTKPLLQLTAQCPIYRSLSVRGGFALYSIIFSAAILCLKKRYMDLLPVVPIMIVSALLLITTPAQHTRYILQSIECALLIVPYSYYSRKNL